MGPKDPPRKCDLCDRTFSRTEHLVRHRRIHTDERPFSCAKCNATFLRADVQQKHMRRAHPEQDQRKPSDETAVSNTPQKTRSKVACDTCRKRKLRCSGELPCGQCLASNQCCTFSRRSARIRPARTQHEDMEMVVQDPTAANAEELSHSVSVSAESQLSGLQPQPPISGLIQSGQPDSMNAWTADQEVLSSTFPHFRISRDLFDTQRAMDFVRPDPLQADDLILGNNGGFDSFWPSTDLGSNFWLDGMDFNFTDDLYGVRSSIDSFPDELPPSELQAALTAYPSIQNATDMVQHYFEQNSQPPSPGKDKAKRQWFSTPLRFQSYDREVINLFISIAKHHLVQTFPILAEYALNDASRQELVLAYAAVGGLFCNVPGRFKIVNSMYNDARRMLLDPFILLEIYGLCSGDKRSYEFVEAFHAKMLVAVGEYKQALSMNEVEPAEMVRSNSALTESLYVLECYRIILLLRPPTSRTRSDLEVGHHEHSATSPSAITALFTIGASISLAHQHSQDAITLSTISIIAWPLLPRGFTLPLTSLLWKPEPIEIALDNWARSQNHTGTGSWSIFSLYHLLQISLHSNIGVIQRFAHNSSDSPFRAKSGKAYLCLEEWQRTSHYMTAKYHALSILRRVKDAIPPTQRRPPDTLDGATDDAPTNNQPLILPEPPHLPYCVYLAGLVLWCGSTVSAEERTSNTIALDICSQLLSAMRVRVAELLDGILRELKT